MKIDKAINTLDAMLEDCEGNEFPVEKDAIKLGIEALKRCRRARVKGAIWDLRLLPGETK